VEDERKEETTERVTLAIAEKSAELAFSEGYRCAIREIAGIVLAVMVIYSLVYAVTGRE
jgi:hypothetical protein